MNLLERLNKGKTLVFDGAMGTMLIANGLATSDCPEEWNMSHSDVVTEIHRSYFAAGCDIVETNSFGGSCLKLARYGLADRAGESNRAAAENARAAAGDGGGKYVAGSVGPTGEFIEPYGTLKYDDFLGAFKEQAKALEDGGADIICVETMADLNEARAGIEAAKTVTGRIVFASMTFNPDKKGYRTMMGVDPVSAARSLEEYGADVIGINCGAGPEDMTKALEEM
jgi:5-methyltetrahydrofolate--homocysteine methyltransferase